MNDAYGTLRFSKLVVLWDANVLSTHPHLWRAILEPRKNAGCPARTPRSRPGLLHVVLAEGRENQGFISRSAVGWEGA